MILDADAREQLADTVTGLLADDSRRARLAANVADMALRDSDEKIVDQVYNLLDNQK